MKSNNFYKTITLELFLFLVINVVFLLSVVVTYDIKLLVFGIVGITYITYLTRNFSEAQINKKFFFLYSFYLFILLIAGVVNNNFVSYIYADLFSFGAIIFIFISGKFNRLYFFTQILPKVGLIINIVIVIFVGFYILFNNTTIASMEGGRGLDEITGKIMSPKQLMYGSLLLYPLSVFIEKKRDRLFYDFTIIMFIFFSLAMASRGSTVVAIIVLCLTLIERNKIPLNLSSLLNTKVFRIIFVILAVFSVLYQIPKVGSAVDYLLFRFTSGETSIDAERTEESEEILRHFSLNEILFGRGLGAANTYWIFESVKNGVNNVHYGWMFLVLKGGISLLILVYGKILQSIFRLWKGRILRPYAFILISVVFLEFSHTMFISFYLTSFIFIAIAAADINIKKRFNINT